MAKHTGTPDKFPGLPDQPVQRIVGPLVRFLHVEAASGVVLLACTVVALVLANSPASDWYLGLWKTPVGIQIGDHQLQHSLKHWINDGLMAVFFFVVGMEVKREIVLGELRDLRRASLPIAAALGGMIVPAGIYFVMQFGQAGQRGWGIPMATDIAFVVGCMALLGKRVPHGLRVMVLSLAIADDIGAILVIAVGYTENIRIDWLIEGLVVTAVVLLLARIGVRNIGVYTALGVLLWFCFHESGVHATIAGVILGLITPAKSWVHEGLIGDVVRRAGQVFHGGGFLDPSQRLGVLRHVERASREALSPLERLESSLHPWVGFVIMPVFALANAGVPIRLSDVASPVSVAVILGLLLGKPCGIVLASWIAVRSGLGRLPDGVGWGLVTGGGFLAGIGFTMALFIASLALKEPHLDMAKIGVLIGSILCAAVGMAIMIATTSMPSERE